MNRYKLSKAGINATEGIARFNGDKDIYERVLNAFQRDKNYALLVEAIQKKDMKAAFSAAHSLKGVSGNLSLTRLYNDIQPLVEVLRAGSFENAEALLQPVIRDYEEIMKALSQEE